MSRGRQVGLALIVSLSAGLGIAGAAVAQMSVDPATPWPGPPLNNLPASEIIKRLTPNAQALTTRGIRLGSGTSAPTASIGTTIDFASGSAKLSAEATDTLNLLGRVLADPAFSEMHLLIEGHSDTTGIVTANLALSRRRAEAVRDYLVSRFALDPGRFSVVAAGADRLRVQTPDQTPDARNRSVWITNLDQGQRPNAAPASVKP